MIKSHSSGFTLFEMVVYITLSILSITLLSIAFSGIYTHVISAITSTNSYLQRYTAFQCMAKDIAQAVHVIHCSGSTIILKKEILKKISYIGWCLKDTKLMRLSGLYNELENHWLHKTSQVLATNIVDLDFIYNMGMIPRIMVHTTLIDGTVDRYCMLRKLGIAL